MKRIKERSWKLFIYSVILMALFPTLTGCWSAHEVSKIAIVNAMGIDETNTGELEVTTVIVKPAALFPVIEGSEHPGHNAFIVQTVIGKNLLEAMGKLANMIPEDIYFGHLETVIFGSEAARNKIYDCLDFINRGNDFRPNIKLLVANGLAKDVVSQTPQLNPTIGIEIEDLAKSRRFGTSNMVQNISQFTEKMDDGTEDPYTGYISSNQNTALTTAKTITNLQQRNAIKTEGKPDKSHEEGQKGPQNAVQLQGTAVFKGSHLQGVLNESETQGLLLLKGQLKNGVVTLNCGSRDPGTVGVQVNNTKTVFTPGVSYGKPRMLVSISVDADIGQFSCQRKAITSEEIDQLNNQFDGILQSEVQDVLNVAQKNWQTDIFGFGRAFYHNDPVLWQKLSPNWRKGLLKEMAVNVKITSKINRYGLRKETGHVNETR